MPDTDPKTKEKKALRATRKAAISEFEDIYESIKPGTITFAAKNILGSITKHICYILALFFIVKGTLLLIPAEIYDRYSYAIPMNETDFKKFALYGKYVLWFIGILLFFIARLIKNIQVKRFWITEQSDLIEDILEYVKSVK